MFCGFFIRLPTNDGFLTPIISNNFLWKMHFFNNIVDGM